MASENLIINIAAVVVTYHPNPNLLQRIVSVKLQVHKIVIVDNTEDSSSKELLSCLSDLGCHVIRVGSNVGIAKALNIGIEWAASQGCSWILTLDDDTKVCDGLVAVYQEGIANQLKGYNIGILNTQYLDINTGTIGAVVPGRPVTDDWIDIEVMISSGCFFSVETFKKAGGYREDFFLDWFDHDFCLRVRRLGLRNYIYTKPMLEHSLGRKSTHKFFFGIVITTNNHPPQRCYLIARNLTILIRENLFKEFSLSVFYIAYLGLKFFLVAVFEQGKGDKIRALCCGLTSALLNKKFSAQDILGREGRFLPR